MSITLDQLTSAAITARVENLRKFEAACVLCGIPANTNFAVFPPDVQDLLDKAAKSWMDACRGLAVERLRQAESAIAAAQARRKANLQAAAGMRAVGFARPSI